MKTLINATGSDIINLWYFESGKIYNESFSNRSWIFVSGDDYDLSMLEKSLDSSNFLYRHKTMYDIYGKLNGIQIFMGNNIIKNMAYYIENAFGYRLSIYNADINPVLRFMVSRKISFFRLKSLYDHDININTTLIVPEYNDIRINGELYHNKIYSRAFDAINDNTVIIYSNYHGEFTKLLNNMALHGYGISNSGSREKIFESYGRHSYRSGTVHIGGKICIDLNSFIYSESGMDGMIELSRLSSLPLETVSAVTPGTVVSSIEEKEALERNILIPLRKADYEEPKTVMELFDSDRGGIVFTPEPGIYSNVYEIDFSSMYPSIIVKYNISPEAQGNERGMLSLFLEKLLDRRLFYKNISERSEVYAMRNIALKSLLLNSFGYTGYRNAKFGRIDMHEKITGTGREIIKTAMRIAEKNGFSILHGVVDSLWITGNGNVDNVLNEIYESTGIHIVIDSHYKWIAFLPQNSGIGAANKYIGLRYDNTFKVRGIEMRRRDSPDIVKKFQHDALQILKCDINEIKLKYSNIQELKKYYKNFNNFELSDFNIKFGINRHIEDYTSKNLTCYLMKNIKNLNVYPGMVAEARITDKKHNILGLKSEFIDRNYYLKLMERSFKPVDFILAHAPDHVPYLYR